MPNVKSSWLFNCLIYLKCQKVIINVSWNEALLIDADDSRFHKSFTRDKPLTKQHIVLSQLDISKSIEQRLMVINLI